jgi:glycosyltransferase involved in cell wall biosynthesis
MPAANQHKAGSMKKVLIITYYWPPSGGAGVQRWLKFVKYLREFGWEPIVYTPANPEPPDFDESLAGDIPENISVIKKPVWEPYSIYKRLTGRKKDDRITHGFLKEEKTSGFAEKFAVWIRGNFFIPDARCFWIKPSVKFLTDFLRTNPVDVILSSGPPHSMHLIGMGVKKNTNIPWVADFRDPWTEIDFYDKLMLTRFADRKHRKLEKEVLQNADAVIAVGSHLAKRLENTGGREVQVITNGFDPDDFSFLPVQPEDLFTLTHIGSLNRDRNPEILWQAISELCSENEEINEKLRLRFVGKTDYSLKESLAKTGLQDRTEIIPYLPHYEALKLAASSAVLLLLINQTPNQKGIVTGKVFEYMATGRPVLCVGPSDGESAQILSEADAGLVCSYNDMNCQKKNIKDIFHSWTDSTIPYKQLNLNVFSRKNLTGDLAQMLNSLL